MLDTLTPDRGGDTTGPTFTSDAPRTSVRRLTHHVYDPRVQAVTLRGHGYAGECRCGWRGRARRTYRDALADNREHEHGDDQGAAR